MAITFDGPKLWVVLDAVSVNYTAQEFYSAWKRWVQVGNANWPPAFRTTGGDVVAGVKAPHFYYLQNDAGWTIKKPEASIDVRVEGNLLFEDPDLDRFTNPVGAFTPTVEIYLTNIATIDVDSLLTAIAAAGLTAGERERIARVYMAHFHRRSRANQVITLYAADGITPLYQFDAPDDGSVVDPTFDPGIA